MTSSDRLDHHVYLLRHGRTPLNAAGRLRGRIDSPLDEVGRREASDLGQLFSGVALSAIVSSPLSRAVETADAVARHHPHIVVEIDADLSDRDWGPWAGHLEADVIGRFGRLDDAPSVEDPRQFQERTVAAVTRLCGRAGHTAVLAVAHDAVNRAVLAALAGDVAGLGEIDQHTGCWNHLVYNHRGWWAVSTLNAVPGDGRQPA